MLLRTMKRDLLNFRVCVSIKKKQEYRDLGPLWIVTLDSEKIDNDFVKSLKKKRSILP